MAHSHELSVPLQNFCPFSLLTLLFFLFCGFSLNDLEAETGTIKKEIKEVEKVSIHKKRKR